jgi:hypothetical protein
MPADIKNLTEGWLELESDPGGFLVLKMVGWFWCCLLLLLVIVFVKSVWWVGGIKFIGGV